MTTDKELLRYAGFLGHTVIVIRGPAGDRGARFHTCDINSARRYAIECDPGDEPQIYVRSARGWRKHATPTRAVAS